MATRRHFLQTLMAAFAGSALIHKVAPAEINPSWLTAKPLPPSTDMALDWWSQVADEALRILEGELRCVKIISPLCGNMRHGDHISLREPLKFVARDYAGWGEIESLETMRPVVLDHQSHVDLLLEESETHLSLKEFSNRRLYPAMASLAGLIFDRSRGAELIVSAQEALPERRGLLTAATLASNEKLNLGAQLYTRPTREEPEGFVFPFWTTPNLTTLAATEKLLRFDMLWGALRPS